jgi:hypothetical protein
VPDEGLRASGGPTQPIELPDVLLASLATVGLVLVFAWRHLHLRSACRVRIRMLLAVGSCSPVAESQQIVGIQLSRQQLAEGEGFEPSVDRKAHNGFRDRACRPWMADGS